MSKLKEILDLNKSDLVSLLKDNDLEFDQTDSKSDLQYFAIQNLVQIGSSNNTQFNTQQERLSAIKEAGKTCITRAVDEKQNYKVVESFRQKDKDSPLYIRPSHYKNHENQETVLEILIPSNPYVHVK